ncbi:putative FAD monooxygenase [Pyronema omphalodes]|nr:putative FAD monooxygenase [Pyronema omphalodes]
MTAVTKESNVDVLIVGAGPAGYMAATWLARFPGLKVRFVEKRDGKIFAGQADGIQCRTLEVFQSFGFADRVWKDANHMLEISFWNPDESGKNVIRTGRIPDMQRGLSRYHQVVLHQGWIEGYFRDNLRKYNGATVEHSTMPQEMIIDESKVNDLEAYPIKVTLRHLNEEGSHAEQFGHKVANGLFRSANLVNAKEEDNGLAGDDKAEDLEVINAKYVLGCDGAHSWVRRQLGFQMIGEQTDYVWGVLDIVPITNFPDIRNRCAIHSAEDGSVMVIPRENALVRLYIQMKEIDRQADGRVDRAKITPEKILAQAQKIMHPYTLSYEEIQWFTAYQIGQRVVDHFQAHDRVFILGDAAHTHSPKAGQGMNVSMMDSYNLGWKIGGVLNGTLDPKVLSTYELERSQVAHDLINFDQKFAKLFSGRPAKSAADEAGISLEEFHRVFELSHKFASGVDVEYVPSPIVAPASESTQSLATNIPVGKRFNSFKVLNQSDARPWEFQELMKSDGRWRIVVFAGDVLDKDQKARVEKLAEHLDKEDSFMKKYTPADKPRTGLFHILTCHSSPRIEVELHDFPKALRADHDYWSVYVDDESHHEGHGQAYKNYGVDPKRGCLVVVRPDQYVSMVVDLEEVDKVEKFFAGCLVPRK